MYNENEIPGGYLLDAMEQLHRSGDAYTNPQALIHHYPHISRDLEELVRQGLLRMDGARVYSAKVFAAVCVAAANLAHRLYRLMKAVE